MRFIGVIDDEGDEQVDEVSEIMNKGLIRVGDVGFKTGDRWLNGIEYGERDRTLHHPISSVSLMLHHSKTNQLGGRAVRK